MQGLTLLVAIIGSGLILLTRPRWWLPIFLGVVAFYPCNLTVPLGTIDFTAGRIVIFVMLAKGLMFSNIFRGFKLIWLDKLIIIYFIAQIAAGSATMDMGELLENRAGAICDLMLPYFIVRAVMKKKEDYLFFIKAAMVIAVPIAVLGIFQSITGINPYEPLRQYAAWGARSAEQSAQTRYGLYRATGSFPQPIMFGLYFAMLGPMAVGLYHYIQNKPFFYMGIAAMGVGAFSSLSSGPYFAAALSGLFIAMYHYRKKWKTLVLIAALMCLTVEVISNRHFYEVLDRFSLSGSAVWYRSRLIEVALFEGGMNNHWVVGYGHSDPNWGPRIDGRSFSDVVNHYLVVLCRYGLVGLIPFLTIVGTAMWKLVKVFKKNSRTRDAWMLWCFSGAMFGTLIAMNSVMLFGPPWTIFYIMLALCAQIPSYFAQSVRYVRVYYPQEIPAEIIAFEENKGNVTI
ncbi:MAG: hypothetical protein WC374_00395 [Phycisphaerae bacterium]|jgi:hypothetical protein